MKYKLGKRPARLGAIALRFADVFDASKLPTPPQFFGHWAAVSDFGMLANDKVSDCIFAGAAHETMVFNAEVGKVATFNDAVVISDYSAATGYIPSQPKTDQGGDMPACAEYRRTTGILDAIGVRHKIDAYVALDPGDIDQLFLATYLTGACGMGFMLPNSADGQTDKKVPWSIVPHARIEGGHYVPAFGRQANGNIMAVTWGMLQEIEPDFYMQYNDESVVYLSLEILDAKNLSPEGYDSAAIAAFLASL
jgi:hypothetical protein